MCTKNDNIINIMYILIQNLFYFITILPKYHIIGSSQEVPTKYIFIII